MSYNAYESDDNEWYTNRNFRGARHIRPPQPQTVRYVQHVERDYDPTYSRHIEQDFERSHERYADRQLSRDQATNVLYQWKIEKAIERMNYQVERYPKVMREYIQPYTRYEDMMKRTAETLHQFDEDRTFLATKISEFIHELEKVPDDLLSDTESDTIGDTDEDFKSDQESMESEYQPRSGGRGGFSGQDFKGFMHWSSFEPYALSSNPDIVDDRRKSLVAIAENVGVTAPTPIGPVTLEGFLGLVVRVLRPQDWRAYFRASEARILYLPTPVAKRPTALELERLEDNLLGVSHFTGPSSSMTCLTYTKSDYGTITQFEVEWNQDQKEDAWPNKLRPIAAMTRVPKKLLRKIAKSVSKSNKTILKMDAKATKEEKRFDWASPLSKRNPHTGYSPNIRRPRLPRNIQEVLAMEKEWLNVPGYGDLKANLVCATIPQMLAWLHVKASYLTDIEIEGIEVREASDVKGIVRWENGPTQISHQGKDPCIIVLHPSSADWVTGLLYWTGPIDS